MALILNIDTATNHASICLSNHKQVIALEESFEQKNHATFLQPAIKKMFQETHYSLKDLNAIAVSAGPGSYTGLRVGLSTAKGLCYVLQKPLLMINTLIVMASEAQKEVLSKNIFNNNMMFCPMIDARRMEVFTGIYSSGLEVIKSPHALIFNDGISYEEYSKGIPVLSGSGAGKAQIYIKNKNVYICTSLHNASNMVPFSYKAYINNFYCDLAYTEPFYVKPFFSH